MNRRLLTVLILISILALILMALAYSWTFTPYGRMDLGVAVLLKLMPDYEGLTVEEERRNFRRIATFFGQSPFPVSRVRNLSISGPGGNIPIRVYWPNDQPGLPILLFFHGGAFRFGDLDTHDPICRWLAIKAGILVVSVDYRLAPEHPFPAAVEDCYTALEWVTSNAGSIGGDKGQVVLAGDSAGGNLAAVISLMARDLSGPEIAFQLLIYPRTNMADYDTFSWRALGQGYFLTRRKAERSRVLYLPEEEDRVHPYASPLLAEDHSNLPPTLLITAGFDPLQDEGEAYARKLQAAGVPVRIARFDGVIHGFLNLPYLRKTKNALDEAAAAIRQALESQQE